MRPEPSERLQKKLRIWLRKKLAHLGQLDILVEDVKCQQANAINSSGLRAQVKFLLRYYHPRELRQLALHEVKTCRNHNLLQQSKTQPMNNISYGKKKKKRNGPRKGK